MNLSPHFHLYFCLQANNDAEISAFVKTASGRLASGASSGDATQSDEETAKQDQKKE